MLISIRRLIALMVSGAVETIYPRTCAGCGLRGEWLCDMCEHSVPSASLPISCRRCGVPPLGRKCHCRDLDPIISMARSAFVYDGWVSSAIRGVKYHGESARAEHLSSLLSPELIHFGAIDGMIPVPLHPSREKQRGYNQAKLFVDQLSRLSGVPLLDVLRRDRNTVTQTQLSGPQRLENVQGAFSVDPSWFPLPGGRYVLVDDVRTTGATLNGCAETLRPFQPAMVGVLTFALDMHKEQVEQLRQYEAKLGLKRRIAP